MVKNAGMIAFWRDLFFPPHCTGCRRLLDWHLPHESDREALCRVCLQKWENETLETCGFCAKRVSECTCMPKTMEDARCAGFSKTVYYTPRRREPIQNQLIYRIKRANDGRALRFLADAVWRSAERMLKEAAVAQEELVVTYLPRGRRAKLSSGIDQAELLARELGRIAKLPVKTLLLRQRGAEREQKRLSHTARLENAKRSFLPNEREDCRGKVVLLVDDLVTTGAGMSVCAKLLRRMGAKTVFCAAVAADSCLKDQAQL